VNNPNRGEFTEKFPSVSTSPGRSQANFVFGKTETGAVRKVIAKADRRFSFRQLIRFQEAAK
jgi:hypothetical protein